MDFVNSGAYSCEVIVDTTFHTLIETKKMLVIRKYLVLMLFVCSYCYFFIRHILKLVRGGRSLEIQNVETRKWQIVKINYYL